jgi:hypothetical protein
LGVWELPHSLKSTAMDNPISANMSRIPFQGFRLRVGGIVLLRGRRGGESKDRGAWVAYEPFPRKARQSMEKYAMMDERPLTGVVEG